MSETGNGSAVDLPAAWQAAVRFCPYCAAQGCERCRQTGDLMGALLEQAYELGRDAGVTYMREVYRTIVYAGKHVSAMPAPMDLKRQLGLWQ